ncbi:hydrolase, partial [Yersinia pestis]
MNGAAFVSSMILAVIFTTATVQASPVAYQKEAITENNLPVFYPQLKQQMNYQSSWLAGKYTDFALWRSC